MAHSTTLEVYSPPADPHLDILYEDEAFLVFNKPSGLLSVPGKNPDHSDSMLVRAQSAYSDALLIHRLDMETSGVFLMARTKAVQKHLGHQFEKRRTVKKYNALVSGHPSEDEGFIDLPLICDWPNRPRQKVDHEVGKPAQTHWRCLSRETLAGTSFKIAHIELTPVTGRSHQLRVHLAAISHPILGDPFYADEAVKKAAPRMQLHATSLRVMHPLKQEFIEFTAPLPF